MADAPPVDALLEDYKLKVDFAVQQTGRLQTQFQVMLTLQAGLATALVLSNTGGLSQGAKWIALIELFLSIAWVAVGYSGRERARQHHDDAEAAGTAWASAIGLKDYRVVGDLRAERVVPILRRRWTPGVQIVGVIAPAALVVGWLGFSIYLIATAS